VDRELPVRQPGDLGAFGDDLVLGWKCRAAQGCALWVFMVRVARNGLQNDPIERFEIMMDTMEDIRCPVQQLDSEVPRRSRSFL